MTVLALRWLSISIRAKLGLLYYVMASSQTLGDALKRVARYSQITNEALVVGYREGNRPLELLRERSGASSMARFA